MSSYLTIYAKLKNIEKPASLFSWSRNNSVYQAMKDKVCYIGNGDEWNFTELTIDLINEAIQDIREEIEKSKQYLEEYEKNAGENEEYIHYIVESKEDIKYAQNAINELEFIRALVDEVHLDSDCEELEHVEKYLANID